MDHPQGGAGVPALINWNDNINTFDFFGCLNSISRLVQMLMCYVWLNIAFYKMKLFIFSVLTCLWNIKNEPRLFLDWFHHMHIQILRDYFARV